MIDLDKTLDRFDLRHPSAAFSYGIPLLLAFGSSFFGPEILRSHFDDQHSATAAAIAFVAHYIFWILLLSAILAGFKWCKRWIKRRDRVRRIRTVRGEKLSSTTADAPETNSEYSAMDVDEKEILREFIDNGVSELIGPDFRASDDQEYLRRRQALTRLVQRKYIYSLEPNYKRRAEKFVLTTSHFAYLSAHPDEIGSTAPVRRVAKG